MKKIILSIILAVAAISADAQFLFRISGRGLKEPSYMLGTIHYLSGSLLDSIPEYMEAEQQCRQMYVEHKPSTILYEDTVNQLTVDYPDGKNIFDVIDKESAEILTEKYKEATGISLSDPTMERLWKGTPASFQDCLASGIMQQLKQAGNVMDIDLMDKAQKRGWNVGQLDDERMKINDLIGYLETMPPSIEAQTDSLLAFLKDYDGRKQRMVEWFEMTCNYWRTGDYKRFVKSQIQDVNQHPKLLSDRNEKWLPRMQAAIHEKPTMFVFGSGHLIGEHGIIAMLREAGYKVKQVKCKRKL